MHEGHELLTIPIGILILTFFEEIYIASYIVLRVNSIWFMFLVNNIENNILILHKKKFIYQETLKQWDAKEEHVSSRQIGWLENVLLCKYLVW